MARTYLWLKLVIILRLLLLLEWGVWGVLKTKNFVENVNIKGRVNFRTALYYFAASFQRIKIRCYNIGRGYASLYYPTKKDIAAPLLYILCN